jgi:hypothetical protein
VIDYEPDKSNYTEENDRENNCKRPENPGPWLSFSDLLNGVAQRESRSDCAERSKAEGGQKSIEFAGAPASMLETVKTRQHNRKQVNDCDEVQNCEA